ncbi:hypothetical protein BH10PSE17_BH10PSE17_10100 [soil metagenome]
MRSWIWLALLCTACTSTPPAGESRLLTAPGKRITDQAIQADQQSFAAVQSRIHALNENGTRRVADYHLAKAQCWLDVSFHEYSRNDRSPFPDQALEQSVNLISVLEAGRTPGDETPLVNGAARLRSDLWERAAALHQGAGARCAARMSACAEVELVHAGNEINQQGWRHAKPYVQIAEDLIAEGGAAAEACPGAPAPTIAAAPAPVSRMLVANVLFTFDRFDPASIRPETRAEFDQLIATLKGMRVTSARVVGHADRLNHTGNARYNDTLARRRAETVTNLLVAGGVDPAVLRIDSRGDDEPVVECKGRFATLDEQEECLLANRRARIEITAVPR